MGFVLKKDWKTICTVNSPDPPTEISSHGLNITTIISKMKISCLSELPQFSLTSAPENKHEKNEWGRFLGFLQKHDKVAVAKYMHYYFYILPPKTTASSPVSVAYQIDKDTCPRDCESGSHLAEEHGGHNTCNARDPSNGADVCSLDLKYPRVEDRSTVENCDRLQPHVKHDRHFEKNYIRADPSYLKTLGQVHSGWIFGGIAELVDNSRDAKASEMDIFVEMIKMKKSGKDVPMLAVIDDGQGMSHDEVVKMVSFGHKQPDKDVQDRIGRFGVGFKTGAMRLGRDALVLTQTTDSRSLAFLSQSLNEGKDNIEIPIVSYCRQGQRMEVDIGVQSEALAKYNLKAIEEFSPFDKYLIGEKAALFYGGTGTQIYIWNLDRWGSECCLKWHDGLCGKSSFHQGDIFICSKRSRSRQGQVTQKVPLDYSLRAYLEVIFLVPRMKIFVQGTLVKSRPLANFLTKTVIVTGDVLGKRVELILGFSQLEWEQASCGIFLYWHGRLIEAYKRVGGMIHNADVGRGVIGVIDVTNLMDDQDGRVWVHNNKQGFQDSESYALLEQWLGRKADEYWDKNFDSLKLDKDNCVYKPDCEWVQCDKCRKWRILPPEFDSRKLPIHWFCYMEPFQGRCADEEQKMQPGMINISTKRSENYMLKDSQRIKMEDCINASGRVTVPVSLHSHATSVPIFNGLNFSDWCEQIQFHLGVLDLDLALQVEKPVAITDDSSNEEKAHYKAWEMSNRLSLMFMRMSIASNIKSALPKTESAKEFMKFMEERSQTADKYLAGTLITTLTSMKFDGSRSMHEHVIEMTNIAARLKSLGMVMDENFLVQLILNSLPSEYGPFQMNYNTMKDKWNVHELHSMLVQEETRLKNQGNHSIHYMNHQGAGKKVEKKHGKGKGPLKIVESSSKIQKKESKNKCNFCGKSRHFQNDCPKRRAWFEKKGIPYNPNQVKMKSLSTWTMERKFQWKLSRLIL